MATFQFYLPFVYIDSENADLRLKRRDDVPYRGGLLDNVSARPMTHSQSC